MKTLGVRSRGCCGCLVLILLLLLAIGCAFGFSLWNVAVANADGGNVVRLSQEVIESDYRTSPAGVFYEHEVTVMFDGGEVWLASTADGVGEVVTDDQVKLVVSHADGSEATWEHDFQSADRTRIVPLPATELSELFEVGQNRVKITLTDVRSFTYSSSAYYLVIEPDEQSGSLGLAAASPISATMTITPTQRITPTVTMTPTQVAHQPALTMTPTITANSSLSKTPLPSPTITATVLAKSEVITATTLSMPPRVARGNGKQLKISDSEAGLTVPASRQARYPSAEGIESEGERGWSLTWLIWPSVMGLVVAFWRRRRQQKKQISHTRLLGWLEGMDWQTGDVLPLVNLSVYPKGAAIVANPLRLIELEAQVEGEAIEGQVIAELQPTLSGVPELVVSSSMLGLMTEEVRIGNLQLEYRNPFVNQNLMTTTHDMSWG